MARKLFSSKLRYADFRDKLRKGELVLRRRGTDEPETPQQVDKAKRKRYLKQYLQWLWPYRRALLAVFILALLSNGMEVVLPMGLGLIVDHVLQNDALEQARKVHMLFLACGGLLLLLLLSRSVTFFRFWIVQVLNAKIVFRLRQRLYDHMLKLSLPQLSDFKTGGIVSRLGGDIDAITGLVQMGIISPAVAVLRIGVTVVIVSVWNWKLAAVVMAIIPPLGLISWVWVKRVRPIWKSAWQDRSEVSARVNETFGGIRIVRTFRREAKEARDHAVGHHTIIRKRLFGQKVAMAVDTVWELLIPMSGLAILWYGGFLFLRDQATLGQILAFNAYTPMLLYPVYMIIHTMTQLQQSFAAMDRVFDVFDMPQDKPDRPGAIEAPAFVHAIRFEQVNFEYEPGRPVLHDFDLTVQGGSTIALVGPSGAGKSTTVDLVSRFHDPTRGRITLNGIDLRDFKHESYRHLLGAVHQDVFLFDGTVHDNIAYGRRHASRAQVIDAAIRANAHDFIEQLADGYESLIGERGIKLSGGQRQRISIARAILADPQILILDEATSNLDTESEQLIQASLRDLFQGRTTFVIAHRLSTIAHADMIVVLDEGRIVETGNHNDLMAAGGKYYEMVERQRQYARDGETILE